MVESIYYEKREKFTLANGGILLSIGAIEKDCGLIEKDIERIDSIISCRFIRDGEEISEIHIVSDGTRSPKQISRDVQSILIAMYDLNIDYKMISIAELPGLEVNRKEKRLKIEKISFEDNGKRVGIKVALADESKIYESGLSGINTNKNIERMLVEAVLNNVEESLGTEDKLILEEVRSVNISSGGAVVVVLIYISDEEEKRLCGSSLIEGDHKKAVVKATLDALNRIILR